MGVAVREGVDVGVLVSEGVKLFVGVTVLEGTEAGVLVEVGVDEGVGVNVLVRVGVIVGKNEEIN